VERAYEQPGTPVAATTKKGRTVPIFIGAVLKFGPKDKLEQKRYSLALSVVEPIFSNAGISIIVKEDPLDLTDTYRVDANDRATWYGISFASRLDLKQSIGASMYLSVRKLNHSENGLTLGGGMPVPGDPGGFIGTTSAANTQRLNFKAFHFVFRFGWLYRLKPQLQLGVMVQPPGIPLKQQARTLSQGFVTDPGDPGMPTITNAYFVDGQVNANLPLPAEIEAGLEYWPAEKVMLSLDAAMHFPVQSGSRVNSAEQVPVGGLYFDGDTARRFIGNVAVAGDFVINKKVMIEAGFFTDLSSARDIPENPVRYHTPQTNRLGGTLSLGLHVAGVSLAVGSTFIYGKGDATGVVVDTGNLAVDYTRTEATSRTVFLHITGATQAASDLGDKTTRGIKKRQEEKAKEAEEAERLEREAEEAERLEREAEEAERLERDAEEAEKSGEPADPN